MSRARSDGYVFVGASNPESGPFRVKARARIRLASSPSWWTAQRREQTEPS
jgi:hypothetical protein